MRIGLRYRGHRCTDDSAVKPWYFAGSLDLEVGREIPIAAGGLVLGRGATAQLRVASNGVARHHARIHWSEDGRLVIEDLQSSNGTYVNGVREERCVLRVGDVIAIADYFDFEVVELA